MANEEVTKENYPIAYAVVCAIMFFIDLYPILYWRIYRVVFTLYAPFALWSYNHIGFVPRMRPKNVTFMEVVIDARRRYLI